MHVKALSCEVGFSTMRSLGLILPVIIQIVKLTYSVSSVSVDDLIYLLEIYNHQHIINPEN